jgi:hypothetical protein
VWDAVAAQLQGVWGLAGGPLERRHVWLAQPPAGAAGGGGWGEEEGEGEGEGEGV